MGTVFRRKEKGQDGKKHPVGWYVSFTGIGGSRKKIAGGETKEAADEKRKKLEAYVDAYKAGELHEKLKALTRAEIDQILSDIGATEEQRKAIQTRVELLRPREQHLTVSELREMWSKHAGERKRSFKDDDQRFTEIVHFFGAETPIALITADEVDRFRDHLLEGGPEDAAEKKARRRRKTKLSAGTVNRYLQTLRGALRLAEQRHYQTARPFEGVSLLPEDNERNRLPTLEEYERLIGAARGELRLLIVLARWTAMRASEILGLEWKRIDLKRRLITLESKHTKGKKHREVPLPSAAIEELKRWPRRIDTDRLFERTISTMSPAFAKLCATLEIEDLHLHDLRHFRLTELRRAGADLFVLQQISGHRTLEMLKRYSKVSIEDMQKAVDAAERD
jgi:integrase